MKELFAGVLGDECSHGVVDEGARAAKTERAAAGGFDLAALLPSTRREWRTALCIGALVSAGAGFVVLKKLIPSFAAEALVSVEPVVPTVAYTGEEWRAQSIQGFYSDYVRTLVRLARTPEVARTAAERLKERDIHWIPEGVDDAEVAAHLAARIQVTQVRETQLVSVRFEDSSAELVAPVTNAITEALLDAVESQASQRDRVTAEAIDREAQRLRVELNIVHRALDSLSKPLGSAMADERHNIYFERIDALQESWSKALLVTAEAESERQRALAECVRLTGGAPDGELERLVDDDPAVRDARVMLGRLARDEEAQSGHLSDAHPERVQALERVREAADRVVAVEDATRKRLRKRVMLERAERAATLEATSQARVAGSQRAMGRIQEELELAREAFREHGRAMFEASKLRAESSRILRALDRLTERAEVVRTESNAPGRVSVAAPAVEPRRPAKDRRKLGLIAALFLGGVAGIGAGLLRGRVSGA